MPTQPYLMKDGTRVPGTTTIIGRFKPAEGLIHWSWNIAHDGLLRARALLARASAGDTTAEEIAAFLSRPLTEWDYRAKRDQAADAGTCAHDEVECLIRRRPFDTAKYPPAVLQAAKPAIAAFQEWATTTKLEAVETEVPLVSERYRFGGTLDAMLVSGKLALGDWKTAAAIYGDNLCQLAAYGLLWEERYPDRPIEGGYHLLRFSKQARPDDPVHFQHSYWSNLDAARTAFLLMRELYDLMARLKKFAA